MSTLFDIAKLNFADLITECEDYSFALTRFPIYFAKKHNDFGVDIEGTFVSGTTLITVDEYFEYDPIHEELSAVGAEAEILLPAEGIQAGKFYEAFIANETRDWETGYVDSYEIHLKEYL